MGEYMVMIWQDEAAWYAAGDNSVRQIMQAHDDFQRSNAGALRGGNRLRSSGSGASIRDGVVTDGAFTETKEVLGGYYLIDAAGLDEAVAIAGQLPSPFGRVEVRPVWPSDEY